MSSDNSSDNMINIFGNKYEIEKKIGKGSFGEVYKVYNKEKKICVASKIEAITCKSRLKLEYNIYKYLEGKHIKNIPEIYEYINCPKFNILNMQLLSNSLDSIFAKNKKNINLATIMKLGIDMTLILKDIHNANVIHRDIKPGNFMLDNSHDKLKLYLLDFGLAKNILLMVIIYHFEVIDP